MDPFYSGALFCAGYIATTIVTFTRQAPEKYGTLIMVMGLAQIALLPVLVLLINLISLHTIAAYTGSGLLLASAIVGITDGEEAQNATLWIAGALFVGLLISLTLSSIRP